MLLLFLKLRFRFYYKRHENPNTIRRIKICVIQLNTALRENNSQATEKHYINSPAVYRDGEIEERASNLALFFVKIVPNFIQWLIHILLESTIKGMLVETANP